MSIACLSSRRSIETGALPQHDLVKRKSARAGVVPAFAKMLNQQIQRNDVCRSIAWICSGLSTLLRVPSHNILQWLDAS